MTLAEAFPPGEYLRDELQARGWTASEFARRLGISHGHLSALFTGQVPMSASLARGMAKALGTSSTLWLGLERAYRTGRGRPAS
jgi:HTH-type transcriptional regulator/antitoxin HigA